MGPEVAPLLFALVLAPAAGAPSSAVGCAVPPASGPQLGTIELLVTDGNERPLPGALVTIGPRGTVGPGAALTSADGKVSFDGLRCGAAYEVRVAMAGFALLRIPDLHPCRGPLRVALSEQVVRRVVIVCRDDIVNLDRPRSSTTFGGDFLNGIPGGAGAAQASRCPRRRAAR